MRSKVGLRALALAVAAVLGFAMVATVFGDAADPGTISATTSGFTASVSGTWTWASQNFPCQDRWVGWAIDWNDPADPGNAMSNGWSVGTASDNAVHSNQNCGGQIPGGKGVQGTWGSLSHTYAKAGTYAVCVATYDIHTDPKSGQPTDPHALIAGGPSRNMDNSVDNSKQAPGGPGCTSVTIQSPANIVVQKSVNKATAGPGDTLAYSIALQNTGGTAGSVNVTDDISALLAHGSFVKCSNGCGGTSTLSWSGISVPAGATTTLTYSVALDSSGWGTGTVTLPNVVVVPNTNCSSGSGAAACRTSTTVSTAPNLVVRKTVSAAIADPGDSLTYTITIQNTGNGAATGVSASDDISALLAYGSFVSCTNGCSGTSTLAWSGLSVAAGSTTSLTYVVKLDSSGWATGTVNLPNTVVVPNSNCAAGSQNAACATLTTVTPTANLTVEKSVSANTANPGDTLNYPITIRNTGNGSATGVTVSDDISALLAHGSFVSCTNNCSGTSTLSWSGISLAAGASVTLGYGIKLDSTGWTAGTTTLPNTVVVPTSDCAAGAHNSACSTSTAVTTRATLVVHKSVNAATANPGDTLTYTIGIQNTGNAAATAVSANDDISALLANGSFGSCSGGCTGTSTLSWSGMTVNPGTTTTLTYSIHLDAAGWPLGTTTLPNTVVVPSSDCASGSSNPACSTSTTVTTRVTLVVHKAVSASSADPGDTLTYTITVQNTGNATATGGSVSDDIGAVLAHASFGTASSGGTLSGSVLTWDGLTFAAGSSRNFTFSVRLDTGGWPTGTTTLANTVVVPGSDCASGSSNGNCRVTTTVTPKFGLTISKGVGTTSDGPFAANLTAVTGDVVWYSITVTNPGDADLSGVTATDSMGLPIGSQCPAILSTLAAGATWSCTYFRTATTGTTVNTATADSSQTSAVTDSATVVAAPPPAPEIHVVTTASASSLPVGGGGVTYTYVVTNTGNVPLSSVTVTDDQCASVNLQNGDTNGNNRLDTTESWTFTCSTTLSTTTTDSATASGAFGTTHTTSSDGTTVVVIVAAPALHIATSVTPTQLPVGGGTASYTYVVTNVGNAALSSVSVTDDTCSPVTYVSGDTNSNSRLDLTETWRFTCSTKLTQTTTDTATARGTFGSSNATDSDGATVTVPTNAPGIRIVNAANPTSLPAGGGPVTHTYVVTNTGNAALSSVTVTDNRCSPVQLVGGDTNSNSRLDTTETWHYSCTATITATTTNIATVTASSGGTQVRDTDSATVVVTASNAAINVVKSATPTSLPAAGGSVTYTYVVTNKGNVALSNISLVDDKCAKVTSSGGDTNGNGKLDLGESWTFSCTMVLKATTTNTVLATGFMGATPVTDTDSALVTVGTQTTATPRVGITKTASPVSLPAGGGSVTYTYAVTNKGDVPLTSVTVSDNACGPVTYGSGDSNSNGTLDLTETWTYTCTAMVSADTTNIATVTAHFNAQTVTASDTATVTVAPPAPTPEPTAAPSSAPSTGPSASGTPGASGSAGASGSPSASGSPNASGGATPTPGTSGLSGSTGSEGPDVSPHTTGGVLGATSPPKQTIPPELTGLGGGPAGTTPSGMVMILILLTGLAASVVILTLSKRTNSA